MFCARFAGTSRPLQSEGAGNAGRPMRPIAACANVVVERTRVSQVTPEITQHSPRNGFNGFLRALPGDRALLPPSLAECSANLTPASGCQDHTPSPSASVPFVNGTSTSTASHRAYRDDREPPLLSGETGGEMPLICPVRARGIWGLTENTDLPVGQSGGGG